MRDAPETSPQRAVEERVGVRIDEEPAGGVAVGFERPLERHRLGGEARPVSHGGQSAIENERSFSGRWGGPQARNAASVCAVSSVPRWSRSCRHGRRHPLPDLARGHRSMTTIRSGGPAGSLRLRAVHDGCVTRGRGGASAAGGARGATTAPPTNRTATTSPTAASTASTLNAWLIPCARSASATSRPTRRSRCSARGRSRRRRSGTCRRCRRRGSRVTGRAR